MYFPDDSDKLIILHRLHNLNCDLSEVKINLDNLETVTQQILLELYDRGIAKFRPDQLTLLSEREAKRELTVLKEQNSQLVLHEQKFEFGDEIPEMHRSAFANYFMGLKDFIFYTQGKNIQLIIDVNGSIKIKITVQNSADIKFVQQAFKDYVLNISRIAQGEKPLVNTNNVSQNSAEKAMIFQESSVNSLTLALKLKDSALITEKSSNLYLQDTVKILTQENLILQNAVNNLQDDILKLATSMDKLKLQLLSEKVNSLNSTNIVEILEYLTTLEFLIKQREISAVKNILNKLSDFRKLNQEKLTLIGIENTNLNTILEIILAEAYRYF
jgi:hypothetical protein